MTRPIIWRGSNLASLLIIVCFTLLHTATNGEEICIELVARFETRSPDGVSKEIITVNGQFPAPTIEARIGDTLKIRVHNRLIDRQGVTHPTSVHFHGIEMFLTPWFDGPEQVAQCPIQYNQYMDYTFTLYQSGTYWYHSHHSWQYIDGFWGLLIVKNTPEVHRYDDEMFMTLMDWHHRSGGQLSRLLHLPRRADRPEDGQTPVPDSALINGRGNADCNLARSLNYQCHDALASLVTTFDVIPGRTYRIRVLNPSARAAFNFSIDGHKLRTIEVDGVDTVLVRPVDVVTIWPAQRYSFLVTMDRSFIAGNAWIRANMIVGSGDPVGIQNIKPLAAIHYLGANPPRTFGVDGDEEVVATRNLLGSSTGSLGGGIQGRPASRPSAPWEAMTETADNIQALQSSSGANSSTFWVGAFSGSGIQAATCAFTRILANQDKAAKTIHKEYLPVYSFPNPYPILLDQRWAVSMRSPGVQSTAPQYFNHQAVLNATFDTNVNSQGLFRGFMNGFSYNTEQSQVPAVFRIIQNQMVPSTFVPVATSRIRTYMQVVINNLNVGSHPWHLHGHTFWVIGTGQQGDGPYNPAIHASRLSTAGLRRDTTHTPPQSWTVVRFEIDNPGVWLLHCHIHWHLEIGLGAVFVEAPNELKTLTIPAEAKRVCRAGGIIVA